MTSLGLELKGLGGLTKRATKSNLLGGPLTRFFTKSAIDVQRRAKQYVPVDTGRLRGSIGYEVDSAGVPLWAVVGTNVFYAPYVEFGTDPHFPPPAALDTWARRHGFTSGFQVARRIAMFGTQEHPYLIPGLEDSAGDINRHLTTAAGEIEAIWHG